MREEFKTTTNLIVVGLLQPLVANKRATVATAVVVKIPVVFILYWL